MTVRQYGLSALEPQVSDGYHHKPGTLRCALTALDPFPFSSGFKGRMTWICLRNLEHIKFQSKLPGETVEVNQACQSSP